MHEWGDAQGNFIWNFIIIFKYLCIKLFICIKNVKNNEHTKHTESEETKYKLLQQPL